MKRIQLPSLFLAAVLQALPLTRLTPLGPAEPPIMGAVLRLAAFSAAILGSVDAISGATILPPQITNPLQANANEGEAFELALSTAPYQSPYWTADGLPEGLSLEGSAGNAFWEVAGIPRVPGIFLAHLTAFNPEFNGPVSATLEIVVTDPHGPPLIAIQPQRQNVGAGQPVSFLVRASGAAPLTYQWLHDDSEIRGATSPILTLNHAASTDAGSYSVLVRNAFGEVKSAKADLNIDPGEAVVIESIEVHLDHAILHWLGDPEASYEIWVSDALSGPWSQAGSAQSALEGRMSAIIAKAPNVGVQFYRVLRTSTH